MVYNFFRSGFLPRQLNHTLIVLISKVANPMLITHYRPISLCNVAYKIITKLLLDCLRAVMGKLIYFPQVAFVPGRSIQENTAIAQEIFHSMKKKKGRKGLVLLKLIWSAHMIGWNGIFLCVFFMRLDLILIGFN